MESRVSDPTCSVVPSAYRTQAQPPGGPEPLLLDLLHHPRVQVALARRDGDRDDLRKPLAGRVGADARVEQPVHAERFGELAAERGIVLQPLEELLRLGRGDGGVQILFDDLRLFRRHGYLDLPMQLWSSLRPRKSSELMALTVVRWRPAIAVTDSRSK